PYPTIGSAAHVSSSITLDHVVTLASKWMQACDKHHPKCSSSPAPSTLPKRVLDVLGDRVRLVDTLVDDDVTLTDPYMTLSHCWGSRKAAELLLKTSHDTIFQHRQQIPWDRIPKLFQDVIQLVRALGCRYVWIDSLCIIQGDQEDWIEHSASMADIYHNATLNIAATAMRNSRAAAGLFQPRIHGRGFRDMKKAPSSEALTSTSSSSSSSSSPTNSNLASQKYLETIELGDLLQTGSPIFARISHDRSHEVLYGDLEYFRTPMEPLINRAWVFQERLLSRRTLHFGASELLWECRTSCFCECSRIRHAHALSVRNLNLSHSQNTGSKEDHGISTAAKFVRPKKVLFHEVCSTSLSSSSLPGGGGQVPPLLDFWLRAVEEYSFLFLSHEMDRPFALAGIAKRIQSLLLPKSLSGQSGGNSYMAGLWAQDLARAMLWAPIRSKKVVRAEGMPSWSWMARSCFPFEQASTCAVKYKHVTQHAFEADSRLRIHPDKEMGTFCEYEEHGNQFGRPVRGQICLSAASCWATVEMTARGADENRIPSHHYWNGRNPLRLAVRRGGEGILYLPFAPDCPGLDPKTVFLGQRVLCVLFGGKNAEDRASASQYLLALAPLPGEDGIYRRTGFCETEGRTTLFDDVETSGVRTMKII
ncbi:heterokaryon incompatibility protein-domain-containing protein, partial [Podospora didyma]